ncbi:MAG: helix-turn-helix domain-containing protein [Oscillospiraceae bacterium]|jgi:transcriptional regulator with XRE-family HTH domain|nr:helix-turn-helix domain-containing protein [Oscillospiraceae bacterium]
MDNVRYMRLLRMKFRITAQELADAAGVSQQYISDIELGRYGRNASCGLLMQKAFEKVIEQRSRQVSELSAAFAVYRDRLLDYTAEDSYEL